MSGGPGSGKPYKIAFLETYAPTREDRHKRILRKMSNIVVPQLGESVVEARVGISFVSVAGARLLAGITRTIVAHRQLGPAVPTRSPGPAGSSSLCRAAPTMLLASHPYTTFVGSGGAAFRTPSHAAIAPFRDVRQPALTQPAGKIHYRDHYFTGCPPPGQAVL